MILRIVPAEAADADSITRLLDDAAARQAELGSPMWVVGQFEDEIREAIEAGTMFVAGDDDGLVGCFVLDRAGSRMQRWLVEHGRSPQRGVVVGRLAVARGVAGSGVGARLLDAAIELARTGGSPSLWLDCPAENDRLRRYYEAAGFSHIGDNDEPGPNGEPWVSSVFERQA